jgi:hypothetical protein
MLRISGSRRGIAGKGVAIARNGGRQERMTLWEGFDAMERRIGAGSGMVQRQSHEKSRPSFGVVDCPNSPLMGFDDGSAYCQAHSHPIRLGGVERCKQTVEGRLGESLSTIGDGDDDCRFFGPRRDPNDPIGRGGRFHGFERIAQ